MKTHALKMQISTLYIAFALLATLVNLLTQELSTYLFANSYQLSVSMFLGTFAGLVVKYILDKKYIFNFSTVNHKNDLSTFFFYGLMGIVTTLLFWVTEYAFDAWFETKEMRYIGAIIGLSIGYITKYHLDKKFVFVER